MTSDSERKAAERFGEIALVEHWQPRVKAEQKHTAPWGQLTTVKDCYSYGYLKGRSSALRDLEQVAREAFDAGQEYERYNLYDFDDYWRLKTESKEGE